MPFLYVTTPTDHAPYLVWLQSLVFAWGRGTWGSQDRTAEWPVGSQRRVEERQTIFSSRRTRCQDDRGPEGNVINSQHTLSVKPHHTPKTTRGYISWSSFATVFFLKYIFLMKITQSTKVIPTHWHAPSQYWVPVSPRAISSWWWPSDDTPPLSLVDSQVLSPICTAAQQQSWYLHSFDSFIDPSPWRWIMNITCWFFTVN